MSSIRIYGFLFDEDNEDKFVAHNLSALQVYQVLENEHLVVRNRKGRAAGYLVIGRDSSGTCIAIPISRTADATI